MANRKLEEIEGIGPVIGEKLRAAGVSDTDSLLACCTTPKQRADLAAKSGVSDKLIMKFANMADLFRVNGVGPEYAELLEAAGVDTVPELARRNVTNLAKLMGEVNEKKKLVRRTPAESEVGRWVEAAKALPRALEY